MQPSALSSSELFHHSKGNSGPVEQSLDNPPPPNPQPLATTNWLSLSMDFFLIFLFIHFLAVLGLRCCARAFSSCSEQGLLFLVVRGLLIAVASLVAEHGL